MTHIPLTPSQTVGPFFHGALLCTDSTRQILVTPNAAGEHLRLEGRLLDGDGKGVPDGVIEIWQANHHGRYHHALEDAGPHLDTAFVGFGRCGTDDEGGYWFETLRPGRVAYDETRLQAPHISIAVHARGLLNHLFTRAYFADDDANAVDPVLQRVPAERRASLMAHRSSADEHAVYRFDITLHGAGETVFFDFGPGRTSSPPRTRR